MTAFTVIFFWSCHFIHQCCMSLQACPPALKTLKPTDTCLSPLLLLAVARCFRRCSQRHVYTVWKTGLGLQNVSLQVIPGAAPEVWPPVLADESHGLLSSGCCFQAAHSKALLGFNFALPSLSLLDRRWYLAGLSWIPNPGAFLLCSPHWYKVHYHQQILNNTERKHYYLFFLLDLIYWKQNKSLSWTNIMTFHYSHQAW